MKRLKNTTDKPWGSFHDLAESKGKWHIKILSVKKGKRLSLQKHSKRSEFWVVVEGKVKVQKGDKKYTLTPKGSIFIEKGELHRISAIADAIIIEITFGNHYEKDIVRLSDDYGRSVEDHKKGKSSP